MARALSGLTWVCAAILAACVAVRFPPWSAHLARGVLGAAFVVAGAALGVACAAEARMPRGNVGPLWMRVALAPRIAMALALSFSTTVIAQTLQLSLGPVDPTFPASVPLATNALWFFVFTIGFSGIGMMSAPGVFLPVLHPIARILRRAPLAVGLGILGAVVGAAGLAFAWLLVLRPLTALIGRGQAWCDAHAQLVTIALLVVTVGPALLPSRGDD